MCILCTIIRITISNTIRRLLFFAGATFVISWVFLFAQVFWTCEGETGWKRARRPQCTLGFHVALAQVISTSYSNTITVVKSSSRNLAHAADVYADTILIAAPIKLIWHTRLRRAQKIRIAAVFTASIGTSAASVAHGYFMLRGEQLMEALAAVIEVGTRSRI